MAGARLVDLRYNAEVDRRAIEMAKAAKARIAGIGAAPVAPPVAPVAPAAGAPVLGRAYGAGRILGSVAGRAGPIAGLGAMGFGMADQAAAIQADPETKPFAERALQVLSGADVTGLGAWAGRKLTGRPEPVAPAPMPAPTATPYVPDPSQYTDAPMTGVVAAPAPVSSPVAQPALMTAEDIRGTRIPASGMGAFVNNATGAVTNLDTRAQMNAAGGYGAGNRSQVPGWAGLAGAGIGAMMNQRRAAATDARALAEKKLAAETAFKGLGAAKTAAETVALTERNRIAGLVDDPVTRAAILAGHNPPTESYGDVTTSMPDKEGRIQVRNNRTGEITLQMPVKGTTTLAAAIADAKRNRAYVNDEQVRRDTIARGYKIVN